MKLRLQATSLAVMVFGRMRGWTKLPAPAGETPENFRAPNPCHSAGNIPGGSQWWEVFKDEKLQELIRAALAANYDLRDAVARVDAARANLGITRSNQFPQVGASGDLQFTRTFSRWFTCATEFICKISNRNWGEASLDLLSFEWTFGDGFGAPQRRLARIC